jgi:hypothetical protein
MARQFPCRTTLCLSSLLCAVRGLLKLPCLSHLQLRDVFRRELFSAVEPHLEVAEMWLDRGDKSGPLPARRVCRVVVRSGLEAFTSRFHTFSSFSGPCMQTCTFSVSLLVYHQSGYAAVIEAPVNGSHCSPHCHAS